MKYLSEDEVKSLMGTDAYQNKYNPKFEETQCLVKQSWENLYPDDDRNENPDNYYIWNAVVDDKTRSSHAERDGQVFCWDSPPEGGHPGEEYNCRCTAEPYKPPEIKSKENDVSNYDNAVYGLAAASQGYSLGFSDEIEEIVNGTGHIIAKGSDKIYTKIQPHLAEKYPNLPKNIYNPERGFVDAFKEGYKSQRDERRAHLKEGKEKAPIISTTAETLGAIFSPVKLGKTNKAAPLGIKSRKNLIEATVTGGAYGVGISEKDDDYGKNVGMGAAGGYLGKYTGNKLFGRGAERHFSRAFTSNIVNLGSNNLIEAVVKEK